MKLNEIQRVLNETFQKPLRYGQKRHLVFWYDGAGEFKEDIEDLQLDNVRIWKLTPNNFFATKYELEKKDPDSSFLIYAPIAKPSPREDWLYDQLKMGIEFSTDKTAAIMRELGLTDNALMDVFKHYAKFFNNKQRFAAFQSYKIDHYDQLSIDIGVLSVLCRNLINKSDEAVKTLMRESSEDNNRSWQAIEKFGDVDAFWRLMEMIYGYSKSERSLQDLYTFFMLTNLESSAPDLDLPESWQIYLSKKPMNVVVLMNQFMNQPDDRKAFQKLSESAAQAIHLEHYLDKWEVMNFLKADGFQVLDETVIRYIETQLTSGVGQFDTYLGMIAARRTLHWYPNYQNAYEAVEQAIHLFRLDKEHQHFIPEASSYALLNAYIKDYYRFDQAYRKFYAAYDRWQKDDSLMALRKQVEVVYSNSFMRELSAKWTQSLKKSADGKWSIPGVPQQTRFYTEKVQPFVNKGERIFVIISDAFRYEAGKELADRLNREQKGRAEISVMQSTLPSYTALGMAALLPHRSIHFSIEKEELNVLIDNHKGNGTYSRETILQKKVQESAAVRAQELRDMRKQEMRQQFYGKKVIYIYHNRIDASGDHAASETEVLSATGQAIDEITAIINKLVNNVSASVIYVTADHGYLYQRDPIQPSEKLAKDVGKTLELNRRYLIGKQKPEVAGTLSFSTVGELSNDPPLFVTVPNGTERFMVQGAGSNYVHGGAMPQEIAVPVVIFRSERDALLRKVNVKLMGGSRKVTNMITFLEFFQSEPVEEKMRPRRLKVYFIDPQGMKISNENHVLADHSSEKPADRVYREKFVFNNRSYDRRLTYFLVLEDGDEKVEKVYERIPFTIDIAFSDDFGF